MISYDKFINNLKDIQVEIEKACIQCGRSPGEVRLLPVTKNHPAGVIEYCYRAKIDAIGENKVQEANEKKTLVKEPMHWELIGHLQSNKVKQAVQTFDRIQTIDSEKLLMRVDRISGEEGKVMPILIEVNAGNDPAKHGIGVVETEALVKKALECKHLKIEGLMTIAPLSDDSSVARKAFATLRETRNMVERALNCKLPTLSMGMSDDFEDAIKEGSTIVRVGTALFGER